MIKARRTVALAALIGLALMPVVTMNVRAQSDRAKTIGLKLKCMCRGCDMTATLCSHPGGAFSGPCPTAKDMLKEVDAQIGQGKTNEQIMDAFVKEYGSVVYVEPPKSGFGLVAWIMPFVYIIAGLAVVAFVLRKWLNTRVVTPASSGPAVSKEAMDRARAQADRETEE